MIFENIVLYNFTCGLIKFSTHGCSRDSPAILNISDIKVKSI